MAFPYYAQVTRAHNELVAAGQIKRRDNQEATEHDKGLMTRRAGYYANQLDPAIGILEKTSGNNALGYSVDLLIHRDGTFWDIATDNAGLAMPVDGAERGPNPTLAQKWRQPTSALAGLETPTGPTTPPPATGDMVPVVPFNNDEAVRFGLGCNDVYVESGAAFDPGMIVVYGQREQWDVLMGGLTWDQAYTKQINAFRAEYQLPPL